MVCGRCRSSVKIFVSPEEAVRLRPWTYSDELEWAYEMAKMYGARPLEADGLAFYNFIVDVFHAGRISGKREDRARRKSA